MAWYPSAVRRPVRRFSRKLNAHRINLHTAVSSSNSLFGYFNKSGNPCSHFYVSYDGTVEQYIDTGIQAAADLNGNDNTISIETAGMGGANEAWRDKQMVAMTKLIRWIFDTHPAIPRKIAKDAIIGTSSHGLSWHRLGVHCTKNPNGRNGFAVNGAMRYSSANCKTCPGDKRISQIPELFKMATHSEVATNPTNTNTNTIQKDWFDMATYDDLKNAVREVISVETFPTPSSAPDTLAHLIAKLQEFEMVKVEGSDPARIDDAVGETLASVRKLAVDINILTSVLKKFVSLLDGSDDTDSKNVG